MAVATQTRESLTWPRVTALLVLILILAFALPYSAVWTLHQKRLRAADESTRAIADHLTGALGDGIPTGTEVLAGPGDRPVVNDERWNGAISVPLARVLPDLDVAAHPDPWGNAYLVNIAALKSGGTTWVLSAGPDGIVQTPFLSTRGVLGDDRATPVR